MALRPLWQLEKLEKVRTHISRLRNWQNNYDASTALEELTDLVSRALDDIAQLKVPDRKQYNRDDLNTDSHVVFDGWIVLEQRSGGLFEIGHGPDRIELAESFAALDYNGNKQMRFIVPAMLLWPRGWTEM